LVRKSNRGSRLWSTGPEAAALACGVEDVPGFAKHQNHPTPGGSQRLHSGRIITEPRGRRIVRRRGRGGSQTESIVLPEMLEKCRGRFHHEEPIPFFKTFLAVPFPAPGMQDFVLRSGPFPECLLEDFFGIVLSTGWGLYHRRDRRQWGGSAVAPPEHGSCEEDCPDEGWQDETHLHQLPELL
jgi:hypothetical protein